MSFRNFKSALILFIIFLSVPSEAQDSSYARSLIKKLSAPAFYGRGYLNNGLQKAAEFITAEARKNGAKPFFSTGYHQWFTFDVNTFPDKISLKLNNTQLKPGIDFIPSPESPTIKGAYKLEMKDSLTFVNAACTPPLQIKFVPKLTFGVSTFTANYCIVEVLKKHLPEKSITAEVNIESKVLVKYINRNICAYVEGTKENDSVIVFSAHYDHLGGLGKKTFFPGANDNASGVSLLLDLMRHYKTHPPKTKIVFIFFAGEEAGLIGSEYFINSKVLDISKIKFLINLDLLGTGDDGIMVTNGYVHEKQFTMLQKINSDKGLLKEIKRRGKARNSDHYWFTEAGVPSFFIYTLGGISAYHDVYDVEKTLPLTDYKDVFILITTFVSQL